MSPLRFLPAVLLLSATPALAVGAIAVDRSDPSLKPAYGYSLNQPDRATAEEVAVRYCRRYAKNKDACQAIVWFEKCGVYANSSTHYGFGYGASEADAKSMAGQMCKESEYVCQIVVSVCEER